MKKIILLLAFVGSTASSKNAVPGAELKTTRYIMSRPLNQNLSNAQLADLKRLLETGSCKNGDLGGLELSKLILPDGADFSGTKLHGALLRGVRLRKANFTNANMNAVNSDPSPPSRSEKYEKADFSGSKFENTELNSAIMPNTIFDGCRFSFNLNSKLAQKAGGSQSHQTNFTDSSFKKAICHGANFYLSRLDNADFTGAIFKNCEFDFAVLRATTFKDSTGLDFSVMIPNNLTDYDSPIYVFPEYNGNRFGGNTVICGTVAPNGTVVFVPSMRGQCSTLSESISSIRPNTPNDTKAVYYGASKTPSTIITHIGGIHGVRGLIGQQ